MYTEYSISGMIISAIIVGFAIWKLAQIAKKGRQRANEREKRIKKEQ